MADSWKPRKEETNVWQWGLGGVIAIQLSLNRMTVRLGWKLTYLNSKRNTFSAEASGWRFFSIKWGNQVKANRRRKSGGAEKRRTQLSISCEWVCRQPRNRNVPPIACLSRKSFSCLSTLLRGGEGTGRCGARGVFTVLLTNGYSPWCTKT